MAVAFASSSSAAYNFGFSSGVITLSPPTSIAAGNLWTAEFGGSLAAAGNGLSVPEGWVSEFFRRDGTYANRQLAWKIAGASEGDVDFSTTEGGVIVAASTRWTGTHQTAPIGTPVHVYFQFSPASGLDPGDLTVGNDGAMAASIYAIRLTGGTYTPSSDLTEATSNSGTGLAVWVGYAARDSGTFSPSNFANTSDSLARGNSLYEIIPAAAPSPSFARGYGPDRAGVFTGLRM